MYRLIITIIIALMCNTISAQQLSEAEVAQYVNKALALQKVRKFNEARTLLNGIQPNVSSEIKNKLTQYISLVWYFEGSCYAQELQNQQAIHCMQNAREGFKSIGHKRYEANALFHIGNLKKEEYDFSSAIHHYQLALNTGRGNCTDEFIIEILTAQRKMAEFLGNTDLANKAEEMIDSVIRQTSDIKSKYRYNVIKGDKYKSLGLYDIAEQWYKKGEKIIEQTERADIKEQQSVLYIKIKDLYTQIGKNNEALRYLDKSFMSETNRTIVDSVFHYNAKAYLYKQKNDSAICFATIDTMFCVVKSFPDPRLLDIVYTTRAIAHNAFRNDSLALADYIAADNALAVKYAENSGQRMKLLLNIGGMQHVLNKHAEAEETYRKYVKYAKEIYGKNSLDYIKALVYQANSEAYAGHYDEGRKHYIEAIGRITEQVKHNIPYLNTDERNSYWETVQRLLHNMTPYAIELKDTANVFTEACYNALIMSKAFLLDTERSAYDIIKTKGTQENLNDYTLILSLQSKLKYLKKSIEQNADSILAINERISETEKKILKESSIYGEITRFMSIDYSALKQILKDDEVIIDFFDYVTKSRGRVYVAYIIDKKHQHPVLKELFTEKDIEKINIPMPDMAYEHPYAEKILKLIWQPLFQYTKNKKTVYYIPSHFLFKIALEALPCDSNTLLGEQYNIIRLSSAREFVRNNRKAPKTYKLKQAVLYGGIEYDMTEEEMYVEAQKYNRNEYYAMHRSIARGDTIYRPLPETEREINEIETILKKAAYNVQPFSGTHGTEEAFISMSGNAPKILHIATHGFYYTPQDAKDIDFLNGYSDAMLLSGLVLAGGNRAWMGKTLPKQTMDGILTADNIAQLDLEETELVVLSACQTAQGKTTAEGLYGLQRAFKKAGVKTIVMSLWNVDDAVGKEFMVKFYENMTKHKKENDIRKAFSDTRKYIREKYPEPYYWAGFIMLD